MVMRLRLPRLREGDGLVALAALAVLLCALPFARLLLAALAPGGGFDPAAALAAIGGRAAVRATLASLETSAAAALVSLALGTLFALALQTSDVRGRRPLGFLFAFSMLVAPQVVALAFVTMAGPSSPLLAALGLAPAPGSANPMLGLGGMVLVLGLHHAPLVAILVGAGLRNLPQELVEAAALEGAGPGLILRRIVLPLLRPQLVGGLLLAFVAALGNFGIPALLGIPANVLTLPTLIYRRLSSFGPEALGEVAALSLLVGGIAGLGVVLGGLALGGSVRLEAGRPLAPFWRLGRARPAIEAGLWALIALALLLPLASLLAAALVPAYGVPLTWGTLTLDNFAEVLWRQPVTARAFRNSLLFAGSAALLLALAAVPLAWVLDRRAGRLRGPATALIELPYALPGVVLAIAMILLLLRPLPLLGVSLYATPWIILASYLARFLAVALKPALAAMALLEASAEEAASLDGASLAQRLRHVVAPALLPAVAAGGLLVFLIAFNELTVSALLWTAGTETLGVVLFSLEDAGLSSQAAAVAVATVAAVALAMGLLDRLAGRLAPGVLPWRF